MLDLEKNRPWRAAAPTSWPVPPTDMTVSAYEEIRTCPRRFALSTADYPEFWRGRGYPPKPHVHALRGSAIHLAVEIISKRLVLAGCPSVQDPLATEVLKQLGGYTQVVQECIQRVLKRFAENPRGMRLLDGIERTLRGQAADLRTRVQAILSRLRLPPSVATQAQRSTSGSHIRRPLTAGAFPEVELRAPQIRWKGKADLLLIHNETCEITDFKSGAPDDAHRFQVRVYALLWSLDTEINPTARLATRLVLSYSSGDVEVQSLTAAVLREFEGDLCKRREDAETALRMLPPEARPAPENCRYCGVRQLCDSYWEQYRTLADRDSVETTFGDAALKILRRHGPMSFDAVLERSPGAPGESRVLLRVHDAIELQAGERLRVLDAAITLDRESETSTEIVTLTMNSEVFAVA